MSVLNWGITEKPNPQLACAISELAEGLLSGL